MGFVIQLGAYTHRVCILSGFIIPRLSGARCMFVIAVMHDS